MGDKILNLAYFNYFFAGLNFAVADIDPVEFKLPPECGEHLITLRLEEARLMSPEVLTVKTF